MRIDNQFPVSTPPDRVYAFLLDVNRVVNCLPGAELSEVVDPSTFKGKVKIKVGPITVAYNGTARIAERDEANRVAILEAEGRETTGPGSARATAKMSVLDAAGASLVRLETDFTVAGRIANFGRGVMEDVSKRLVAQMADCIKANLEVAEPAPAADATAAAGSSEAQVAAGQAAPTAVPGAGGQAPPSAAPAAQQAARPVNALSLLFGVLWDRIRRLFRRRSSPRHQ